MNRERNFLTVLGALSMVLVLAGTAWAAGPTPGGDTLDTFLSKFEAEIGRVMAREGIPGLSAAVVLDNEIVYLKGFGERRLGSGRAVDPDTVFLIGSISKSFTSALVATVIDRGGLAWNDPVTKHLPGFKLFEEERTNAFRVDDVMSQRSGLPDYCLSYPAFWGYSREHITSALQYIQPVAGLRSTFGYQNVFFLTAAQLVEAGAGITWEQALEERIFRPLGMDRSSVLVADLLARDNHASFHTIIRSKVAAVPEDLPILPWSDTYGPAGGINSTARDMAAWLKLHLNGGEYQGEQVVSRENLEVLHTPHVLASESNGVQAYYCQGWVYATLSPEPILWHNGDTGLAHSAILMVPGSGLGLVMLTNLGRTNVIDTLAMDFYDLFFGQTGAAAPRNALADLPLNQVSIRRSEPARPGAGEYSFDPQPYLGAFSNPVYEARVVSRSGGLSLILGPWSIELALNYLNSELFSLSIPDYMEYAGQARFLTGQDGSLTGLAVDMFRNDGFEGVLTRTD